MNDAFEVEIKEAISKHLPQAVGDVLQERLKKADLDAQQIEKYRALLDEQRVIHASDIKTIATLQEELQKHTALAKREEAIAIRERNAEILELKTKLEAANANSVFARDVALGLVRNIEYRRSVFDSEDRSEPIIPPGSSYQQGTANSHNTRTTTTDSVAK